MTDLSVTAMIKALVRETRAGRIKWEPSVTHDIEATLPDGTEIKLTIGSALYLRVGDDFQSIHVERAHALPMIEVVEDILAYHERLKQDRQFRAMRDLTSLLDGLKGGA